MNINVERTKLRKVLKLSIQDLVKALKAKWYLLVIAPVIFGLVSAFYCWTFMPNVYSSSVTLYALLQSEVTTKDALTNSTSVIKRNDFSTGATVAKDILALAQSSRVSNAAAQDLGKTSLSGYSVSLTAGDSERVIKLAVTGPDPQSSCDAANAIARQVQQLATETTSLQALNIIDDAKVPTAPSGPQRMRYVLMAAAAGIGAALVLIVLLDMFNTTVRSAEDAEKKFNMPVMGNVPFKKKLR